MNSVLPRLIISILTLAGITGFAQTQDIVVTAKGDSLTGKAKIMAYDVIDRVQLTEGKTKKQFTAVQVQGVRVGDTWYGPVRTEYGYRMMKILQPGFLSLYLGRAQNSMVYDVQFLVRRDGRTMEVPNLTFKKNMQEFLSDCPKVKEDLAAEKLTKKDIMTIVKEFNACLEPSGAKSSDHTAVVPDTDNRITALQHLKDNLTNSDIASRSDAIDILNDLQDKIKKNQSIANYQIEALRSMLKGTVVETESEKLVALLLKP
ncbi:MAG TPA: hypothetical protein PLX35_16405 [Cyclobacteriaceae bacterium]|nr:hypothetical protein [Cyclobacteriaceae bacterium]